MLVVNYLAEESAVRNVPYEKKKKKIRVSVCDFSSSWVFILAKLWSRDKGDLNPPLINLAKYSNHYWSAMIFHCLFSIFSHLYSLKGCKFIRFILLFFHKKGLNFYYILLFLFILLIYYRFSYKKNIWFWFIRAFYITLRLWILLK